ncbi:MAG TPA: hypothetical protein VKV95_18825 [Terriglobia bacterium]|nr:hypothetical protein [Terriglobia bacterium]
MDTKERYWNREKLYEEVWATPMQTLAYEYGLSDRGLAKICRRLEIPVPGRGYWAKKAVGQKVERLPLPSAKTNILVQRPAPRKEKPHLEALGTEQERAQVERLEQTVGEFALKRGSLSHPLIIQARAVLGRASVNDRQILHFREQCLDMRVSKGSLDRALRVMAGLIGAIEAEGFAVEVGSGDREQTVANIHRQHISFGLLEKVDRVELTAPPRGGVLERVLTFGGKPFRFEPSGQLYIEVWHQWDVERKRWKDNKTHRLEEQIPQIVAGFIRIALVERARAEKRVAEQEENQRRAAERAQLQQLITTEKARIRALRKASANWVRAEECRSFISAAVDCAKQNGQPVEAGTPFGDWLAWAAKQADRLDPLKESPTSIADRKNEVEPDYMGYYGYRKPDPPFRFPKPIWRMK